MARLRRRSRRHALLAPQANQPLERHPPPVAWTYDTDGRGALQPSRSSSTESSTATPRPATSSHSTAPPASPPGPSTPNRRPRVRVVACLFRRSGRASSSPCSVTSTLSTLEPEPAPRLRHKRPHRPSRGPRPRARKAIHQPDHPRHHLQGPHHRRRPRAESLPRLPATSAPSTSAPASCAGPSTPSRIPASSATTPGPRTPGRTPAPPTTGPAWRSIRSAASSSCPPAPPPCDFYGADRVGDDLFANSLLALNAATGKRIWHFQAVQHDIWDRDFPAPPVLVTVTHDGKTDRRRRPDHQAGLRLRVRSRDRQAALSDRDTAVLRQHRPRRSARPTPSRCPRSPRPSPASASPRTCSPTARPRRTHGRSSSSATSAATASSSPSPSARRPSIFPGFDGGAEWGGPAFDPETGLLYVNANDLAWTGAPRRPPKRPRHLHHPVRHLPRRRPRRRAAPVPAQSRSTRRMTASRSPPIIRQGAGRMPASPTSPPADLRAIVAIPHERPNATTAATLRPSICRLPLHRLSQVPRPRWLSRRRAAVGHAQRHQSQHRRLSPGRFPLGEYPELAAKGIKDTGSENYGGPIVTAGGLVFIAATNYDRKFRAFDKSTGKLLWETIMPSSANGTPATYEVAGRQYVVVAAAGGKSPTGGTQAYYIAFASRMRSAGSRESSSSSSAQRRTTLLHRHRHRVDVPPVYHHRRADLLPRGRRPAAAHSPDPGPRIVFRFHMSRPARALSR